MNQVLSFTDYKEKRLAKCLELEKEILKIKEEMPEVVTLQLVREKSGLIIVKCKNEKQEELAIDILTQFYSELHSDILPGDPR